MLFLYIVMYITKRFISKYIVEGVLLALSIMGCTSNSYCSEQDTTQTSNKFQMQKSPTGAILRSLALPGWGQYYVESYWKVPVFLGAAGTCVYFIVDNNNSFKDKQSQIDKAIALNPSDPYIDLYKRQREVYRDNRDQAAFFLAGVYILSALDAYVGAHLFDFDVSDKISMNLFPNKNNLLNVNFQIKL